MKDLRKNYEKVCKTIGYQFKNKELLYQAFTRSSYAKETGLEDNENLEFIGDRILGFFVTKMLAINYGYMTGDINCKNKSWSQNGRFALAYNLEESNITELKNYLLSNKFLASCIEELGLHEMLYLGKNDIKNNVANNEKAKADLLEAIIGAVAIDSILDCDYNRLEYVVYRLTDIYNNLPPIKHVDKELLPNYLQEVEPITELKQLAEKRRCNPPNYIYKEYYDKNNNHIWQCKCALNNCKTHRYMIEGPSVGVFDLSAEASASTKKDAKRAAANKVLNSFYVL